MPGAWALAAALALYLSINWFAVWNLVSGADTRPVAKSTVQALVLLLAFCFTTFGALALKGWARALFIAAFVVSITSNLAAHAITGGPLVRGTAVWLSTEFGQFGNLMRAWGATILGLATLSALAVLAWAWLATRLRTLAEARLGQQRTATWRIAAVAATLALPVAGGLSEVRMGLAESNIYGFGIVAWRLGTPPAATLRDRPAGPPAAQKVVLIVDESTRPDAFAQTVLPQLHWPHVGYGAGYSIANCSAASNALLRWGLEPARLGTAFDPRTQPSIWLYAKQAGYRTTLIDGQLEDANKSQNFIGAAERAVIDDYVAADIGLTTDMRIAEMLSARMASSGREFIVVVKRGNHFPYEAHLPPQERDAGRSSQEAYRALVAYTTGRFFATLQHWHPALTDTLIFYTSDHGQHHGSGNTHCRSDRLDDEYRVPIVVAGSPPYLDRLRQARGCWDGMAHHQSLRSSVIEAMGYLASQLTPRLYPPLTVCAPPHEVPRFTGYLPVPTSSTDKLEFELVSPAAAAGPLRRQP